VKCGECDLYSPRGARQAEGLQHRRSRRAPLENSHSPHGWTFRGVKQGSHPSVALSFATVEKTQQQTLSVAQNRNEPTCLSLSIFPPAKIDLKLLQKAEMARLAPARHTKITKCARKLG